jgi:5'-3' exonuclease
VGVSKRQLLIDGDEVVFKATSAIEQEVQWDSCNHVLWSNPEQAYENFNGIVSRLYERFECTRTDLILCFSGAYETPNFRLALDETYKRHRGRKPMCYWAVRERAQNNYRSREFPGLEADDVMGILATKLGNREKYPSLIVISQDKDMKTLPATVWNGKDLVTYTAESGAGCGG